MSSKNKDKTEYSDEEEVAEIDVEKENSLYMFGTKRWHTYYFMLSGPTLFYKKSEKDPEVKGAIQLLGATVNFTPAPKTDSRSAPKVDEVLELVSPDGTFLLACSSSTLLREWADALKKNSSRQEQKDEKKKKQSKFMALKKNLAGKAATSRAGKSIMRDLLGSEGVALLSSIKEVIRLVSGRKKATEIENSIIKLGVKVVLLYRNKDITLEELLKPKEQIQRLWSDVLDMLEITFCYDLSRLQTQIQQLEREFESLLKPYISDHNIELLQSTMRFLGNDSLLNTLYTSPECEKLRGEMGTTLRALWDRVYH